MTTTTDFTEASTSKFATASLGACTTTRLAKVIRSSLSTVVAPVNRLEQLQPEHALPRPELPLPGGRYAGLGPV